MTNSQTKNDIARLSINELFKAQDKYIIPIYQRNYARTDTEVGQLIDDIHRHTQGQYYLGSLTVKKRDDGAFEVIDGQQRLTTLFLLLSVLNHEFELNLSFEHRETSTDELNIIKQNGELTDTNGSQIAMIYHYLKSGSKKLFGGDADRQAFLDKLLTNVQIIRTEIPENTDLNQYFERMNNRGEQLEHHEVIKAKLMSKLSDDKDNVDRAVFSAIWNACSDMSRYAVSSFSSDERQELFEDNVNNEHKGEYFRLYKNFEKIKENFSNAQKPKTGDDESKTLSEILTSSNDIASTKESADKPERFTSIIDFPNFLAQVLYLFLKDKDKDKDKIKDDIHRLDDGNLIEQFEQSGLFDDTDGIKAFAVHLLNVRVLFDRHVIKHDGLDSRDDWYIYQFKKYDNKNDYINVFDKTDEDNQIKMLQTMFHYSFPAKNYKYWLFGYLKWLNDESQKELENHKETGCAPRLSADEHINCLEKLCDQFYFNRFYNNGHGDEYFDIIYKDPEKDPELEKIQNHDFLHQGTAVANFIFNRLDYILWRKEWRKDKSVKFKFTARNSVEHFYPQNPPNGEAPDNVDHFGNLCLITHSQNSSLNNQMPNDKKQDYHKSTHRSVSIKQMLMMTYENWGKEEIEKHGKDMIELLNREISTT